MTEYRAEDAPESILDVFLHPGEFFWGKENTRIRTLLGSCVSIAVWHPVQRHGGMCHIMLPEGRGLRHPKYADVAVDLMIAEIMKSGCRPSEYTAKVFGGGNMFSRIAARHRRSGHIGQANVDAAFSMMNSHGFRIVASDTGGYRYRKLIFDIWSGHVWMQKQEAAPDWVDVDPDNV